MAKALGCVMDVWLLYKRIMQNIKKDFYSDLIEGPKVTFPKILRRKIGIACTFQEDQHPDLLRYD